MPFPENLNTIIVTGHYGSGGGPNGSLPATGTVVFTPSTRLADPTGQWIVPVLQVTAYLVNGMFSVELLCTDNANINTTGWVWAVTENINGTPAEPYDVELPHTLGPTVDISTLAPVNPQPPVSTLYPLLPSPAVNDYTSAQDFNGPVNINDGLTIDDIPIVNPPGGTLDYLRADGTWAVPPGTAGAVSSVFGRTGAVVAVTDDYAFTQIAGTATINQGGTGETSQPAALTALAGTQVAGHYLRSDGTNTVLAGIQAGDVPTLNQDTTGNAATATTATSASTATTAGNVTGTVAITNGGTGQTSQQAAINALTGAQSAGTYLRSDGTNAILTAIQAPDVPTLNQNTTGTAGNVTGVVAIANGGTGSSSQNFVDVTSGQNIAGTKTFTGEVIVPAPVNPTDAATKAYVDATAQGLSVKASCQEATTAALPTNTYSNGSSGVGATLAATATGTLTVDGVAVALGDRVLVQNESTASHNGIYQCTTAGASGVAYVLTRTTDMDIAAQIPGAFTFVEAGTVNSGAGFVVASEGPYTIGTTAITWTQFSGAGEITAGTGLSKTGNTISLTTPVSITNGGTGNTSQQAAINALTGTQASGTYLRSNGTNASLTAIQAADVPTLNQNTTGTAANITGALNNVPAPTGPLSLNSQKITSLLPGVVSTDAVNLAQVPAEWLASDSGFVAWTYDSLYADSTDTIPNNGAIRYCALRVPYNVTVNHMYMWITSVGSGMTSGENFFALWNYSAQALIAQSGDMSTAFASTGLCAASFSGGAALTQGLIIAGVWSNSGTAPTFAARSTAANGIPNANLAAPYRCGDANTGVTTTAPNPLVATGVLNVPPWVALK